MYRPPFLKQGDKVAITAPARCIEQEEIQFAIHVLEGWGLQVIVGATIGKKNHQLSGTDAERTKDFQQFLDDISVKAIFAARGGYGTVRMMDNLLYTKFLDHPKWIVGFSDITILHSHLNSVMGIQSLHATMPVSFEKNTPEAIQSLKDALFGQSLEYHFSSHPLNRNGEMQGEVVGGNLSLLYSLLGTKTLLLTTGKILFLEDLDEYLYHIDRMITALKRAGKFQGIAGLIVGGMTDMNDNRMPWGTTAEEIIREHVAEYSFPVCFGFPAGHINDNRSIVLGREAKVVVGEGECCFKG